MLSRCFAALCTEIAKLSISCFSLPQKIGLNGLCPFFLRLNAGYIAKACGAERRGSALRRFVIEADKEVVDYAVSFSTAQDLDQFGI